MNTKAGGTEFTTGFCILWLTGHTWKIAEEPGLRSPVCLSALSFTPPPPAASGYLWL
jgi:hypothetical protein